MKQKNILVAPSILSGDFGHLTDEARRIEQSGADAVHIDIMDGHFVPNLTLGPRAVAAIRKATSLFLDVHIMVYNPFDYIERLAASGADGITFHYEATEAVEDTLNYIRKSGMRAGLAFRPETSASSVLPFLELSDLILLMTVRPGFGGQSFMEEVLEKIALVKEMSARMRTKRGETDENPLWIQVDGGITDVTAKKCLDAGANSLVSGTYLFEFTSMAEGVRRLRGEE